MGKIGRELHACENMLLNGGNNNQFSVIVVAGGRDADGNILKSVEMLQTEGPEENWVWKQGPDLPKALYEPTLVQYGNVGLILAGGNSCEFPPKTICPSSRDIYRLECPWQTEPYKFDPM